MRDGTKPGGSRNARKTRADGQRNRQRVVEAAKLTFTELGPQVSLDAIARRAGVGIGTLYRHFPTRDVLIEAVCRRELEQLAGAATDFLERLSAGEALHEWMRLYVRFIATNKAMAAAVSSIFGLSAGLYRSSVAQITDNPVLGTTTELYRSTTTLLVQATTLILHRAGAAGDIRKGVDPRDLLRALAGFTATYGGADVEGWEASALRLIDIFMEGLRARPRTVVERHTGPRAATSKGRGRTRPR